MKIGTGRAEGLGVDDLLWNEPYLVLRTALFASSVSPVLLYLFCLTRTLEKRICLHFRIIIFTIYNYNLQAILCLSLSKYYNYTYDLNAFLRKNE